MFVSCSKDAGHDWSQFILVVPTVSVGNVGQLACDLLISTLAANRVGSLYDDSVVPVVGPDPFSLDSSSRNIATAIDVYESKEKKVVVVQQRAPLIKGQQQTFVDRLVDWISSCHFSQLIILTSVFAHERVDSQLTGVQTRFLVSPALRSSVGDRQFTELGWVELEKRQTTEDDVFVPGSGIAKRLYKKCVSCGVPVLLLLTFCAEGDNTPDAVSLATMINDFARWIPPTGGVGRSVVDWQFPASWRLLFGCDFDQTLFM
jgi:proteasome assembly chaperone 2